MKYIVTMNGNRFEVEVERVSPFHQLTREEIASRAAAAPAAPVAAPAAPAPAGGAQIVCPMLGTVLAVKAAQGAAVKAGQTVFVVEAMKMENEIVAPVDGTLSQVLVKQGDTVDTDQVMATIS